MNPIRTRVRPLAVALLSLALGGAAVAVTGSPVAAESFPSKITKSVGMYDCTSAAAVCTTAVTTATAGTYGRMVCWEDGRQADGQVRWFYVRLSNGRQGYVPASRVNPQTSVKSCKDANASNEIDGVIASNWALARIGQRDVSAGDKATLVRVYGFDPTLGDWSGDCIAFADLAWYSAGTKVPLRNAYEVYRSFKAAGKIRTDRNPPRGAMVFWNAVSGGVNYGHVEISLGNSRSVGTQGWDRQRLPVSADPIGSTNYLGWATP